MHMTGTHVLRCLLALGLMSGLVACGSFANCFNSGFAPAACGGGYHESDVSPLPQSTATSAEGRWTGTTRTGRTVTGLVLEDGSYWLFYTARDNPHILAGLVHGTGTSHSGSFGSSTTRDFNLEGAGIRTATCLKRSDSPIANGSSFDLSNSGSSARFPPTLIDHANAAQYRRKSRPN